MRKILVLVLTCCYMASMAGVAMQWHYCMGKLRSVQLTISAQHDTCNTCGMEKGNHKCCKDEVSISKISDSHQQVNAYLSNALNWVAIVPQAFVLAAPEALPATLQKHAPAHAPPGIIKDRNILYCVFRC